jgi:hypothetical protein
MKAHQLFLAAILAGSIGAPSETLAEGTRVVQQMAPASVRLPIEGELPSLGIDFWTYTCINWLRSLP